MSKPPSVQMSFTFPSSSAAWDFMRHVDQTGGDALAGYPSVRGNNKVTVVSFDYAVDTIKKLAVRDGGTEVAA